MPKLIMPILIYLSFFNFVYADQIENLYFTELTEVTNDLFCKNDVTLKYIKRNYKQCIPYIDTLSKECKLYLYNVIPDFEDFEHTKENEKTLKYLSILYFSCVKAEVYENTEGVKLN